MKTEHLVRQKTNPGALLNTDNEGKKAYLVRRAKVKAKDERIEDLEAKVEELMDRYSTILEYLKEKE